MGIYERKCIDIQIVKEFDINIKDLYFDYRDDVFFRAYVLKNNKWDEFEEWILHMNTIKTKKRDIISEKNRMSLLYESIREKGYLFNFENRGRDNSITVINIDGKYNILNGSCRMGSIILCGIKNIRVREISNVNQYCCNRISSIKSLFDIDGGKIMKNISEEARKWIINFKKDFFLMENRL